ncbi:stalk domain-containing protein [Heliobacterium mobile]|nr:stalk domain-containing protein [Heliobacterium mobile]
MKKYIFALFLFFIFVLPANAEETKIKIFVNQAQIGDLYKTTILNDSVYVSSGFVKNILDCDIKSDDDEEVISLKRGNVKITYYTNSTHYLQNLKICTLSKPIELVEGKIMFPLRPLCESLGIEIIWDDKSNVISLNKEKTSTEYTSQLIGIIIVSAFLALTYLSNRIILSYKHKTISIKWLIIKYFLANFTTIFLFTFPYFILHIFSIGPRFIFFGSDIFNGIYFNDSEYQTFFDFFYFSAMTFFTVGYGDISINGIWRFIPILEAFAGVMTNAIYVGILIYQLSAKSDNYEILSVAISNGWKVINTPTEHKNIVDAMNLDKNHKVLTVTDGIKKKSIILDVKEIENIEKLHSTNEIIW